MQWIRKFIACGFCRDTHKENFADGGIHDFRLKDDGLFYFDETFGWEGIRVNFYPMCGRKLQHGDDPEREKGGGT